VVTFTGRIWSGLRPSVRIYFPDFITSYISRKISANPPITRIAQGISARFERAVVLRRDLGGLNLATLTSAPSAAPAPQHHETSGSSIPIQDGHAGAKETIY
jgi:hypothetical protein